MTSSAKGYARWAAIAGIALMSACAPIIERHGYVPAARDLAKLTPGVSTRAEVEELLPPPTTRGAAGDSDMYYVFSKFSTFGPMPQREVDRQIVALSFAGDRLTGISRFGLQDGIAVPLTQRATNDNVTNLSFIRQLMGNFGRVDASDFFGPG